MTAVGRWGDGPADVGRRGDGPAEKVLVSGSAGFIGGYVVGELLDRGYEVVGLDNFSKYGKVAKSYDGHPRYRLVEGDARDVAMLTGLLADCDHFIAAAAMIGGISYFHAYAYDLLATNERIIAASCDAAIKAHADGRLRKVTDLVQKVLKGQDPLHILGSGEQVRHYTYGGDLAAGIVTAMEHPDALGEDFNLSTSESTTVLQLAELICRKIKGPDVPLRIVHDEPFAHDVQRRVPSTHKDKRVLGFEAATSLDQMLDEVIPGIARAVETGTI